MSAQYGIKHSGSCLLAGYGPDVRSEVAQARTLRPSAPLLGVKYAACLFPEIEHVWTQHLEQAEDIKRRAGRLVYVHSRPKVAQRRQSAAMHVYGKTEKFIDYTWLSLAWVAASSGIAGALWARHGMGFSEVILCGIPLDHGQYAEGIGEWKKLNGDGGQSFAPLHALKHWRSAVLNFQKAGKMDGITSMSGWTRETLGAPA